MKKIAVIGLGYVGLPLAVEFGRTREVVGYDINQSRIEELQNGVDSTNECDYLQLQEATRLKFTCDTSDLVDSGIFIVTVPTPINEAKRPDLRPLEAASELVGSLMLPGSIVIFESTVYPGATEEVCVPILERTSGLRYNVDFFCGYSPERINPGDKKNTLTKITKITSGSTTEVAKEIDNLYLSIIEAGTWQASSIAVAEAAKVIENSQRDLNIAFVNELSVIFERLGIDTLEVLEAAGSKWNFLPFRPGMVGGHCIGVDPYYLTHKAEEIGYNPQVILSGRRINDNMAKYAAKSVLKRISQHGKNLSQCKVGVLGVTFKENCPDTRNSKVFDLIDELEAWNVTVFACDPLANSDLVYQEHGCNLVDISKLKDLDAIIVAVGHNEYRELSKDDFLGFCRVGEQCLLADLKALYDKDAMSSAGFDIFRL